MRILTLTNLYPNPFQPLRATFNRQQVRALAAQHEIRVIAPILWTEELACRRSGAPALPSGRLATCDGIIVEHPRYFYTPRWLRGWYGQFYRWSVGRAFRRVVADFQPNLVYTTWAYPDGWAAIGLARRAGLPTVLKVHGSDVHQLEKYSERHNGTVEAICRADRVVTVSRDLARRVVELGADPGRVHVIYNGVNDRVFYPSDRGESRSRLGLPESRPQFLYVGNLLPVKGPDVLLEACARLAAGGVDFDLHVIGSGPMRDALDRRAAERGISGQVRFHGQIPHEQLPDWFRAVDLLVLPSRHEGVPNVLLEAMACGTPFVASAVGGVSEVAHLGTGRLVPAGDAGRLAGTIADLLSDPPPRLGRTGAGRTHSDAAGELTAVYEAALGRDTTQAEETRFDPHDKSDRRTIAVA